MSVNKARHKNSSELGVKGNNLPGGLGSGKLTGCVGQGVDFKQLCRYHSLLEAAQEGMRQYAPLLRC
ncbi:unnamed protein product [Lepidochelys olivacea]